MMIVILLLLLLLAAVFFMVLLLSRVHFEAAVSRIQNYDRLTMEFRALFGLVKYRWHVPLIDFVNLSDGLFVKKNSSMDAVAKVDEIISEFQLNRERIIAYYERFRLLLRNVSNLTDWLKDTMRHLECTQLQWQTRIGVGDAPETAITTGIVWSLKSSLVGFMVKSIVMKTKPVLQVFPQYNRLHFSSEFISKTQIRIFYIVVAGFRLLPRIWKAKGSWKSWQHIFSRPRLKSTS